MKATSREGAPAVTKKERRLRFPEKLMLWASAPELDSIMWVKVADKWCVFVTDKQQFSQQCYEKPFPACKRQFSQYGFQCVKVFRGMQENHNRGIWAHPAFVPGADASKLRRPQRTRKACKKAEAGTCGLVKAESTEEDDSAGVTASASPQQLLDSCRSARCAEPIFDQECAAASLGNTSATLYQDLLTEPLPPLDVSGEAQLDEFLQMLDSASFTTDVFNMGFAAV